MRLASHRTAGARLRLRFHVGFTRERKAGGWRYKFGPHRALHYRGAEGDDAVFELHGDDGRTYILRLSEGDVATVAAGRRAASKQRKQADKAEEVAR